MTLQELFDHAEGLGDFGVSDLLNRSVVRFGEKGCAAGWTCSVLGDSRSAMRNELWCGLGHWGRAYVCGYPSHYATGIERGSGHEDNCSTRTVELVG